jgi:hypothetical protein
MTVTAAKYGGGTFAFVYATGLPVFVLKAAHVGAGVGQLVSATVGYGLALGSVLVTFTRGVPPRRPAPSTHTPGAGSMTGGARYRHVVIETEPDQSRSPAKP